MSSDQSAPGEIACPLPAGLPHVAYVLLWYPLFTQPFIFREVEELRKIMPVQVYTLYGRNLRHCSAEMTSARGADRAYGVRRLLPVCMEILKNVFFHPMRTWRLFKRSCCKKWPSVETFGENLWGFCVGLCLGRQFREDGIDFVYAPWPRGAATAAWVGATLAGIPFGLAARGDNLAPADPDLAEKFSAACFVRANNAADMRRMEEFDLGQAKGKTCLIYNSLTLPRPESVDTQRFAGDVAQLLALGRFDVTKGFDVLLQACAILKERGLKFHLTLAGGGGKMMGLGGLEARLVALRKELDLVREVSMPGLVSHDNLPSILQKSDIFVAPCVVHKSGRRDGIPNTVIEAMAYGLPVISTNVNALPEIVRNHQTGLTVAPDDAQALAEAVLYFTANPDKAREYGRNASLLAGDIFDSAANARRLCQSFARVCAMRMTKEGESACAE